MTENTLYVGIDAGGTRSRIAAQIDDGKIFEAEGASCNARRTASDEIGRTVRRLVDESARSLSWHGETVALCAGLAGVSDRATSDRLRKAVAREFEGVRRPTVRITGDVEVAHAGAFGESAGILVIAGTGSIVFGRDSAGTTCRIGGWGYVLGDEGSGHRLGRKALRAVTMHLDGGPETRMSELIASRFGLGTRSEILDWTYDEEGKLQEFAPLLIEAADSGDEVAIKLLTREVDLLADLVALCAERLSTPVPRITMVGGLTASPAYRKALRSALLARIPRSTFTQPATTPVRGALMLAHRLV
jgi:N-acetylglucosamine kinase-like BadF-type ATPase